mmetsp:Transcript_22788/g.47466  ORF Transcript_22788/g.47466 Transcript_22788/m.47466 type:complete len:399 (-) Transcript_22788:21-1217(-)
MEPLSSLRSCPPVPINLGFVSTEEPLDPFASLGYSSWDGGKVGGKPFNLHPSSPLRASSTLCPCCGGRTQFLLQIYAPADDAPHVGGKAFHRMLYVFACPVPGCSGVKVLRAQAGEDEGHFVEADSEVHGNGGKDDALAHHPDLCAVCGLKSVPSKRCPKQDRFFCCREHQVEYMKRVTKRLEKGEKARDLASVFKEMCIVVEEDEEGGDDEGVNLEKELEKMKAMNIKLEEDSPQAPGVGREGEGKGEEDDFFSEKTEQKDINELTGSSGVSDSTTIDFLATIGAAKDQILRYARWKDEATLWTSSQNVPVRASGDIPACGHCGGERQFEFQVMPQLLHLLNVDDDEAGVDAKDVVRSAGRFSWGTIAVYTCSNSCEVKDEGMGCYSDEFAWVQPPL